MSNIKNFGLVGVGFDLQFGKAGTRLVNNAGTFNFKAANGINDAAITAAGITSTGNVSVTTGNLILGSNNGNISIGGTQVLERSNGGLPKVSGDVGLILPAGTSGSRGLGEVGQIRINTDVTNSHAVEFWDGDAWITLATGGNTGVLAADIQAIETALGAGYNSGTNLFNPSAFTASAAGATDFTDAINQVAEAAAAKDTLEEILPGGSAGNIIYYNGLNWVTAQPGSTSGVQGYDAGLAALASKETTGLLVQTGPDTFVSTSMVAPAAGFTITNPDGVAGAPTFALANDLAALEGLTTNGYIVRTADGSATTRAFAGTAGNIVVTNGDGVASDTTVNLATITQGTSGDFVKLSLDTFGRVTGNTPVVQGDITSLVDDVYVNTAGDTMTGNLSMGGFEIIGLPATPTQSTSATSKAYVDNLVTSGAQWVAPVLNPDLVGIADAQPDTPMASGTYIAYGSVAGGSGGPATGYPQVWTKPGTNPNTGLPWAGVTVNQYDLVHFGPPSTDEDALNYASGGLGVSGNLLNTTFGNVRLLAGVFTDGLDPDVGENLAGTGIVVDDLVEYVGGPGSNPFLPVNWNFPNGRVGGVTFAVQTVTALTKTFVITGDQTASFKAGNQFTYAGGSASNGVYEIFSVTFSGGNTLVVSDNAVPADATGGTAEPEMRDGTTVLTNNTLDSHFGQTYLYVAASNKWVQIAGPGSVDAGIGLAYSGTTLNVNLGAGIRELPTDEVGIHLRDAIEGALILTTDGTSRSTDAGAALHLLLDTAGGLEQTATGLRIGAGDVTNAMLQNSVLLLDADTDTSSISLGGTLELTGNSTQGISTSVAGSTFNVTAANASSSQKGVASFTATQFVVTDGVVALGTISNGNLENSSITFTGTSGSDAVALGESMAIVGADSMITTTMGTNSLSIQLATVDVPHGGTGVTTLGAGQVMIGNGTGAVLTSAGLAFNDASSILTIGTTTIQGTATDTIVTATGSNGNIRLVPSGTGQVVFGAAGTGFISAEGGQPLVVTGNNTLVLSSTAGDIRMTLANNTTDKVTVVGPTATDYAANLANEDLVNKLYVDQAIQVGAASGSIKAVKGTVNLGATGAVNIGTAIPAGSTILRTKVLVTAAGSASSLLEIGKVGLAAGYMTGNENDPSETGMYLAETYVTEVSSVQILATVSGTVSGGSATVIVEYQLA